MQTSTLTPELLDQMDALCGTRLRAILVEREMRSGVMVVLKIARYGRCVKITSLSQLCRDFEQGQRGKSEVMERAS